MQVRKRLRLGKLALGYAVIAALGYIIVFPAAWGGVAGIMVGSLLLEDPSYLAEVERSIRAESNTGASPSEEDKKLKEIYLKHALTANWLSVHVLVGCITFSFLGLLAGVLLRDYWFSGILPLLLLSRTLLRPFTSGDVVGSTITIALGLSAQLVTVYLFSYCGSAIRRVIDRRKSAIMGEVPKHDK